MTTIRLAILNDYEIVVVGLAQLLGAQGDVEIVDLSVDDTVDADVDIALYDTFGSVDHEHDTVRAMLADEHVARVVVFTWNFAQGEVQRSLDEGVSGYLSKSLSGDELVDALRRVHGGEVVVSDAPNRRGPSPKDRRWPGKGHELTEKEADVLAFITRGLDNATIAERLFISPNTLKTRIRHLYRKVGVESRVQAALWGVKHGFEPDNEIRWDDVRWDGDPRSA